MWLYSHDHTPYDYGTHFEYSWKYIYQIDQCNHVSSTYSSTYNLIILPLGVFLLQDSTISFVFDVTWKRKSEHIPSPLLLIPALIMAAMPILESVVIIL